MLRQALRTSCRAIGSSISAPAQRVPSSLPLQLRSLPASRLPTNVRRVVATPRWYSTETETATKEAPAKEAEDKPKTEGGPGLTEAESELAKNLEAKEKEALDWKDKYLRSVADFRNLQDRMEREMKSARDFAIQRFAKDLVDSVDNLDRALTTVPRESLLAVASEPEGNDRTEQGKAGQTATLSRHQQDLLNLYEGLKMTEAILMQTLKAHGLERFDPHGEKFNPNEHEATFMAPAPDKPEGTIHHVQQKGFKLNGRVLRAAKVGVVKNT